MHYYCMRIKKKKKKRNKNKKILETSQSLYKQIGD